MTMRWLLWLCPPWSRRVRRDEWLAECAAEVEAERRAALARIMAQGTAPLPNVRTAPLMTRGQRARSNRGNR
jgi:hypothetical protein